MNYYDFRGGKFFVWCGVLKQDFHEFWKLCLQVIPEPLDAWCNMRGHNLLGMFYEDPVRNNFLFQHFVQLTRLKDTVRKARELRNSWDNSTEVPVRLMERSLQNNR